MFALVDCNNFFVSCERVFQPSLEKVPVAVMSNNDGCIVARSNEVKALGIPMAAPVFKYKKTLQDHNVRLLSSNFALYSDFSRRVMDVLNQHAPEVLVYSIDEAFLVLKDLHIPDIERFARTLRRQVKQWTGIPVSIGIAQTKTLAKIANHYAKKHPDCEGVRILLDQKVIDHDLQATPIGDVWGVGWRRAPLLERFGITNALQLRDSQPKWVQQHTTVTGARTQRELRGESCIELSGGRKDMQTIMCTRSFGRKVSDYQSLEQAIASYATNACERLRRNRLACKSVMVYIRTNWFSTTEASYSNTTMVTLPEATDHTPQLVKAALEGLSKIFKPELEYQKVGVILVNLVPVTHRQRALYPVKQLTDRARERHEMLSIDYANHQIGDDALRLAVTGFNHPWHIKSEHRSPRYTTRWNELRTVSA